MASLPFAVQPAAPAVRRIGTEQSGILEIPVRGGLTVAEDHAINELAAQIPNAFIKACQAADVIAKAEGISILEAYNVIEASIRDEVLEPEAKAIKLRHAAAIQEVARLGASAGQLNMVATVTVLVRSRLGLPEWSQEDTQAMPRVLMMGIWRLAQDEITAEAQPSVPVTEEMLGKPQPEDRSPSEPTGPVSSGACAMPSRGSSSGKRSGTS